MTVAAEHMTTEPAPSAPPPDGMPETAEAPRLAEGVELLGEYKNSGYNQPPSLVRRPDGQIIQMSPLLYRVMCRIDGSRDPAAIAKLVSEDLGRGLTVEQVARRLGYAETAAFNHAFSRWFGVAPNEYRSRQR